MPRAGVWAAAEPQTATFSNFSGETDVIPDAGRRPPGSRGHAPQAFGL